MKREILGHFKYFNCIYYTHMFNFIPIMFALFLATTDSIVLSGLKEYSLGKMYPYMIPISMLVYSIQPLTFLTSLKYETMTVMNILWDVTSDVVVSLIGLLYFKERLTVHKKIGLLFSFLAIGFMSYEK